MSGFRDTAFSYDESDLGLDPETKLRFKPNKRELELFKLEKLNMYKGTWMVCFVYGITAIILLSVIFFTEWGRTYIYNKFFPAVITYVFGAIIIIIYLIISIFSIVPRKLRKSVETLPVCPDYWKLTKTDSARKVDMENNIKQYDKNKDTTPSADTKYPKGKNDQYILNNVGDIDIYNNKHIFDYKCVPDANVYGDIHNIKSQLELINENDNKYTFGTTYNNFKDDVQDPIYIYTNTSNTNNLADENVTLQNYAEITGVYKNEWISKNNHSTKYFPNTIVKYGNEDGDRLGSTDIDSDTPHIKDKKPLICNELYPYLLDSMEDKEKTQELKCEYAKKCGVSWSYLDCYKDKGVITSIPISKVSAPVTPTIPAS